MSEFSLPATVSERQGAGRHGRPPVRGKGRPAGTRAPHLYLALVPAALMAVLGLAAVVDVLAVGTSGALGRLALVGIAALAVIVLGAAVFGADAATRRERRVAGRHPGGPPPEELHRRLGELGYLVSRGRQDLQNLRDRVMAGDTPPQRDVEARLAPTDDPFVHLAHELRKAQNEAWNSVINTAVNLRGNGGSAQRVEVFVNLARRMQTLSHRAIQGLDELENQVEDPDLLKGLFRVDHLSTRMRRQAESLAVIGGAASRRQWSRPVTVYEVLRSAIAEVEHYNRVKVVPPVEGTLDGGAVADVIHLLAELIENATKFAPPHTQVLIRAEPVTAGLAIEVEDRGLGIPRDTQRRVNDLLADLERVDVDELVQDGRIGLLVVSALSRRHHIAVKLNTNLYGGTQAVVVVPHELIGVEQQEPSPQQEMSPQQQEPSLQPETPPVPSEPVAALSATAPGTLSSSLPLPDLGPSTVPTPVPGDHAAAVTWNDQTVDAAAPQADVRPDATATVSSTVGGGRRPELPRRRAQTSLAPELLNAPVPRDDDADTGHNPGLMAAFQQGMRSGQDDEDLTDRTGGTG
ncbi:MAG: ATP-binding protein [Pseudonocardiaceae bacterium]